MSDFPTIPPPPPLSSQLREGGSSGNDRDAQGGFYYRRDQRAEEKQKNESEQSQGHQPDDIMVISLEALEEKILEDGSQLLGLYDNISVQQQREEFDDNLKNETGITSKAVHAYAKNASQNLHAGQGYQKQPFPLTIPDQDDIRPEIHNHLNLLKSYWERLETMRENGVFEMPHSQSKSLYQSFFDFLKKQETEQPVIDHNA